MPIWRVDLIPGIPPRIPPTAAGLTSIHISRTDVVTRYGLGEFPYRVLCAFAHTGMAIPFAASQRSEPLPPDAGGLRTVRLKGSLEGAYMMTWSTMGLVRRGPEQVYAYYGRGTLPAPPSAAG